MKNFPALCVDNFYSDPDKVREFALAQTYTKPDNGVYPGKRTSELVNLDRTLFDSFCQRLFSIYYDLRKSEVDLEISTSFQLVEPYENDAQSLKNRGWIHVDSRGVVFAGVVYLTPNIDGNCGTSLYQLIDESLFDTSSAKEDYYLHSIDNDFDGAWARTNSAFKETARFNNVYNRLISFDSETFHGINSFYTDKEPRLTQPFFVTKVTTDSATPLLRMRSFNESIGTPPSPQLNQGKRQ